MCAASSSSPFSSPDRAPGAGTDDDAALHAQARAAIAAFRARFGRGPAWLATAPGRVNLIGEHTDYNDGYVLPIAIDRRTMIAADLARDTPDRSTFVAHDLALETTLNLAHPHAPVSRAEPTFFVNYLLGVIEGFRAWIVTNPDATQPPARTNGVIPNLDLLITSDLPIGAGLSSSASVEVAMLTLLEAVTGIALPDRRDAARLCQHAERTFAGAPCGVMDMFISLHGRRDHALLLDCRSLATRFIRLPSAEDCTVLIIDTGIKHDLAAGEYAARRRSCEAAAEALGVPSLREASMTMLHARGDQLAPDQQRAARHVIEENERTLLAAAALHGGDFDCLGELLFASHESLRAVFRVSCPKLDVIVNVARTLRDRNPQRLIGARMTGGGFGGCALVLCPAREVESIACEIVDVVRKCHGCVPRLFPVRAAEGAMMLAVDAMSSTAG